MPAHPTPPAARSVFGVTGCVVLVFALFWSLVTLVGDFLFVREAVRQFQTLGHASVEGRVTKCQVTEDAGEDGPTYGIDVEYAYQVAGQPYTSDRVRDLPMWGRGSAMRFADDHPPGSRVTVFYDPDDPSDAVLEPGVGGAELFQLLFLLPFNVIMLGLGLGLGRAAIFGEPPAGDWPPGVRFFETGDELRVRFVKTTPAAAALAVLMGGGFFGAFGVALGAGMPPPAAAVIAVWLLILGGAAFAYRRVSRRIASGKGDLVIDRAGRTLTLPQSFGRAEPLTMPFADVLAVEVLVIETKDEDGHLVRYAPAVRWRDGGHVGEDKLVEWAVREQADRLAAWVADRSGVPASPPRPAEPAAG
jgi:hypothetical protein